MKAYTYAQFKEFVEDQKLAYIDGDQPKLAQIDQEIYDHFLGAVPPSFYWNIRNTPCSVEVYGFTCGEPYDFKMEVPTTGSSKARSVEVSSHFFQRVRGEENVTRTFYGVLCTHQEARALLMDTNLWK
jgi:hypothetical protein